MRQNQWYIVKLVFRIEAALASKQQFDEQWRLIHAAGKEEAFDVATALGQAESEELETAQGTRIGWKFISVTDVFPFDTSMHGSEVFSQVETPDSPEHYLESVVRKAAHFRAAMLN